MLLPGVRLREQVARPLLQLQALCRGRVWDRRLRRPFAGELVTLVTPQGSCAAACWWPSGTARVPAVVLVHGSHGPMALYALMAERLAARGMMVLALELPGFGRSPVPPTPWRAEPFTGEEAVAAAAAWLRAQPRVDAQRLSLLGHSFGGSVALLVARRQPGWHAVVALGPTRRVEARTVGPAAKESAWLQARFALARGLDPWPPLEFVRDVSRQLALEYHLEWWARPGHPPVLLIDGEHEALADRRFLAELVRQIAPPVLYRTVPRADHYVNSGSFGAWVAYDRRAVATCLTWITEWLGGRR